MVVLTERRSCDVSADSITTRSLLGPVGSTLTFAVASPSSVARWTMRPLLASLAVSVTTTPEASRWSVPGPARPSQPPSPEMSMAKASLGNPVGPNWLGPWWLTRQEVGRTAVSMGAVSGAVVAEAGVVVDEVPGCVPVEPVVAEDARVVTGPVDALGADVSTAASPPHPATTATPAIAASAATSRRPLDLRRATGAHRRRVEVVPDLGAIGRVSQIRPPGAP